MRQHIGHLTSGELEKTIAAAEWLVDIAVEGLLDPQTLARISTLAADGKAEEEDRAGAARASRAAAMAARESGQ